MSEQVERLDRTQPPPGYFVSGRFWSAGSPRGMLSLAEAVDLAERVGRLPRACNRTRLGLPCDRPAGAKGGPCPDCEAA